MDRESPRVRLIKYISAVAIVAAAVFLNILLTRFIAPTVSPLLYAAVLLSAWFGGWGPGWLATILAALADDYFFIPPIRSIDFNTTVRMRFAVFLLVSSLISYLTSKRRQAVEERDRLLILERQTRAAAENANSMKDRFLAVASHELRTPLSAIVMWADVLANHDLPSELREGITAIQRCADTQRRLIDDLLDVARLHTDKLRLEMQRIDLVAVVESAIASARPLISAKNLQLSSSFSNPSEMIVSADAVRLQQVLMNLFGNAIKFTPEGGTISVSVEHTGSMATVRVKDNGRGMDAADLPHVFDQFWQVGDTKKIAGDGLGLGLAIARDLVKLHGGRIHAESEGQDRGATFVVELPLLPANSIHESSAIPTLSIPRADVRTTRASA